MGLIAEQAQSGKRVLASIPTVFTRYPPITDERLCTQGQLDGLLCAPGLAVRRSFAYGDVPSRAGLAFSRLLPKVGYRAVQQWCGYSMSIAALGVRGSQPRD